MIPIRPEVLAFVQAAQDLLLRVTEQRPLSDEEVGEIASCLSTVEDRLDLDENEHC
jgi:hypothetical protein